MSNVDPVYGAALIMATAERSAIHRSVFRWRSQSTVMIAL
jgi:hypothetical protein